MNPSGTLLSPPTQALGIAIAARKIARRPSDQTMTFGYVRAEVVAALINYTTLIVVGLHLVYEAVMRFIAPQPVQGWLIVIIAAIALIVDVLALQPQSVRAQPGSGVRPNAATSRLQLSVV